MVEPVVYLVDDDPAVRGGLRLLLQSDGWTVRDFASGEAFLAELAADTPGCLITDLQMPDMDGLQLQQTLAQAGHHLPVIVLTGHGNVSSAVRAMKGGALEFIEKPVDDNALLEAVADAVRRDRGRLASLQAHQDVAERLGQLTARENEVIREVAAGKANKVIAAELGISERTVELHRARGMKKLGCRSVADLVQLLIDKGPDFREG